MRKFIIFLGIIVIPFCISAEEIQSPVSDSLTYSEIYEKTDSGDMATRTFYIADEEIAKIVLIFDETNQKDYIKTKGYVKDGVYINKEDNKSFMTFKNGQLDGKIVFYHPTGELRDERMYKEGKPIGDRRQYYQNGKLKQYKTYYDDNSYLQEDYREDGSIKMRSHRMITESILSDTEIVKTNKPITVEKFDEKGTLIKE